MTRRFKNSFASACKKAGIKGFPGPRSTSHLCGVVGVEGRIGMITGTPGGQKYLRGWSWRRDTVLMRVGVAPERPGSSRQMAVSEEFGCAGCRLVHERGCGARSVGAASVVWLVGIKILLAEPACGRSSGARAHDVGYETVFDLAEYSLRHPWSSMQAIILTDRRVGRRSFPKRPLFRESCDTERRVFAQFQLVSSPAPETLFSGKLVTRCMGRNKSRPNSWRFAHRKDQLRQLRTRQVRRKCALYTI